MQVEFKFSPLQWVRISAHQLFYTARVIECLYNRGGCAYTVDYNMDGKLERQTFYEDEMEAA